MNFSKYFSINVSGHKDIDFIDIPLDTDVALYIDPALLAAGKDPFSKSAWDAVKSFFYLLFDYCRKEDYEGINYLLTYVGEANETHLGLSRGYPLGKGASRRILVPILSDMIKRGFFSDGLVLEPHDLLVFATNFSEDRMSDVIFNIIRDLACMFTIEQCVKHRVNLESELKYIKPHWSTNQKRWVFREWPVPYDHNLKPIVLLPKTIVRRSYAYGVNFYLQHFVLEYRQRVHLVNKSKLCREGKNGKGIIELRPPYKKDIRHEEMVGYSVKDYVAEVTIEYPLLIGGFRNEVNNLDRKEELAMSNSELNTIAYNSPAQPYGA